MKQVKKYVGSFLAFCFISAALHAADVDITQGLLHLFLNEKGGTFTLTGFDASGVERKLLSSYGRGSTSFFAVNLDGRTIHLVKKFGTTVKTEFTGVDSARMVYTVKDRVDIIIDFSFFQSLEANSPDSIKLTVALRSIVPDTGVPEDDKRDFALKAVFDTILGEIESEYFSSYMVDSINSERLFSHNVEVNRWIQTKNRDGFGVSFIVAGAPTITMPISVHLSNIDFLSADDVWEPSYVYDRSFDSRTSLNNAGVQLLWDTVSLAPLTEKEYVFYITLADPEKFLSSVGGTPPPPREPVGDEFDASDYISQEDIYGLGAYEATEDSIQSLIERILELESYPDSNQEELDALNILLDNLLAQMEAPPEEDTGEYADEGYGDEYADEGYADEYAGEDEYY
ncbi:MAG: hypothetical protein Ta2A_02570 [Treponemataceae bacterium]|nr:MAG: hypothetical protein Ta2A_02570 [Treponemataceae bacterium]